MYSYSFACDIDIRQNAYEVMGEIAECVGDVVGEVFRQRLVVGPSGEHLLLLSGRVHFLVYVQRPPIAPPLVVGAGDTVGQEIRRG